MLWATGAVWWEVLKYIKDDVRVENISLLGRRKLLGLPQKISQNIVDIENTSSYKNFLWNHTIAICTLGVWQSSKVSKEEFIKIDKDVVFNFAKLCKKAWVKHFLLLSSVWADSASWSFFLRTKWELIDAIKELWFEQFSVFKPSMILTPTNRYGISQAVTLAVRPIIDRLFFWSRKQYCGIAVEKLWQSIGEQAFNITTGFHDLTWSDFTSN